MTNGWAKPSIPYFLWGVVSPPDPPKLLRWRTDLALRTSWLQLVDNRVKSRPSRAMRALTELDRAARAKPLLSEQVCLGHLQLALVGF